MPYTGNDGTRIHYKVEGSGPPLILQHGMFWDLEGWERWGYANSLKRDFQLILVDARGHGGSDKPHDPTAYTLSNHVADVLAVLDALEIPTAIYWGFSMGGWIGFGMGIMAADSLKAAIIGGAHPYGRKLPDGSRLDGTNPDLFLERFFQRQGIDREQMGPAKIAEFVDNDFQAIAAAQQDRQTLEASLASIEKPVLLYVGESDGGAAQVNQCATQMPSAEFFSLPGLNHPESFYRSDLVLPHVLPFLLAQ